MSQRPAHGPSSASGIRRGGDHYQDVFLWSAAMRMIGPRPDHDVLETEQNQHGNVDDLVVRSCRPGVPDQYTQLKWASNTADLLDEAFLTGGASATTRSLLQKFRDSRRTIADHTGSSPTMRLISNRSPDQQHPLLGHIDGRTDLLLPTRARTAERALDTWQQHLDLDRDELTELLSHLAFRLGQSLPAERDHARELMLAAGLEHDDTALQTGLGIVDGWIRDGRRRITVADVRAATVALQRTEPAAILSVQAIDRDPHEDEATVALDFLNLFPGDSAPERVLPHQPEDWATMQAQILAAAARLEHLAPGRRHTVVRGAMRQATFFRVGAALPTTRGHTVAYLQGGQTWSSSTPPAASPPPTRQRTLQVGDGPDLAISVGFSLDPTDDVLAAIRAGLPVRELLALTADPPGRFAVPDAAAATAAATEVRDALRNRLREIAHVDRIHLFLAGPGGFALLLGHLWNRMPRTIVYEHAGIQAGYRPAFEFVA